MMHVIKCIGTRKPRLLSGEYALSSLLVDSHNAHKTDAVKMLCDEYNILLFIVAGGLTPKANLADIEYIKRTKAAYNTEILRLREEKYREKRQKVTDADGVVRATVQPPSKIGTIACMNAIIKAWRENDFTKAKERFIETRLLTQAQGEALGWTPQDAFKDYAPTEEEKLYLESILPPSVEQTPKRTWEKHSFTCIQQKCARKAYYGYVDEAVPRYCQLHKLEGMIELLAWTPSFKPQPQGVPRHIPGQRGLPKSMSTPPVQQPVVDVVTSQQVISTVETGMSSHKCKEEKSASGKGEKPLKAKAKAKKNSTQLPSREGSILQFLSPPSQRPQQGSPDSQPPQMTPAPPSTPLPPLLQEKYRQEFKISTVQYLIELWDREGELFQIEGVPFQHSELSRLLNFVGTGAYLNDNIIDCTSNLMNSQDGDFWVMPSHLYGKYMNKDPLDRWVGRSMKKWTKKFGKGNVPRFIMVPFAVSLHYRVIVWDTHRDRVVYLDPFNPIPLEAEQAWVDLAVDICGKMRTSWSTHDLPPPSYGFEVDGLPDQVDGVSCGLYVIVYMLMFANNWVSVNFPPQGTNTFRVILAW